MGARDWALLLGGAAVMLGACCAAGLYCQHSQTAPEPAAPQVAFELPITDKSYSEMAVFGPESEVDDGDA